jgi:hypothetical protein
MPEHLQEPMNLTPPPNGFGMPKFDNGEIVGEEKIDPIADELARQELARISLSNAELLELAKKNPPPPEYFDGEEEMPFIPIEE